MVETQSSSIGAKSMTTHSAGSGGLAGWSIVALITGAVLWSYWDVVTGLVRDWRTDDNYSVGQLVLPAALYLLWTRRTRFRKIAMSPAWWGAIILVVAIGLRIRYGFMFMYESAERYALWLTIVGVVVLVCGWAMTREVGWVLVFLLLMIPFPGQIHNAISGPLQNVATAGATVALETLGYRVIRQGNVLVLGGDVSVTVAEACSGLRMLTAFITVAAVLAFLIHRPAWQKAIVVLSSVPIAIACNLVRLVATAMIFSFAGSGAAERFFHDFAGVTMMPLAVVFLVFELWFLSRLVSDDDDQRHNARV